MANVQGTFYTGSLGRIGSSPQSAPDLSGQQPFPVNPPNSGVEYAPPTPDNGLFIAGDVIFNSATDVNLNGFQWRIDVETYIGGEFNISPIEGTPSEFPRIDIAVGKDDSSIDWIAGIEDENGAVDPAVPSGTILLTRVLRLPDGTNTVEPVDPDLNDFVDKVSTGLQTILSNLSISPQSGGSLDLTQFDANGIIKRIRSDKAANYSTLAGTSGWAKVATFNLDVPNQLNYSLLLVAQSIEQSNDQFGLVNLHVRLDSSSVVQETNLSLFGKFDEDWFKLVRPTADTNTFELYFRHGTTLTQWNWTPLKTVGQQARTSFWHRLAIVASLPAGTEYSFSLINVGGASTFLGLTDTPSSYSGQAGLFPRVNGGESALIFDSVSPYDLNQEGASDGQVLTWVTANSRYEPVTPSGGGGGNFIAYDVAQSLTGSQRQQALDNIGSSAGSVETFNNSGATTINNLVISKSNIEFTGSSTVTLNGIVPLWDGQEITITNRTGNTLTITQLSAGSSALNTFIFSELIPTGASIRIKYGLVDSSNKRWIAMGQGFYSNFYYSPSGYRSDRSFGFGRDVINNVRSVFRAYDTVSTEAARFEDSLGNQILAIKGNGSQFFKMAGFGRPGQSTVAVNIQAPNSAQYSLQLFGAGNEARVLWHSNGNMGSVAGAFFGGPNNFAFPGSTQRVIIRGTGITTGQTLLLEDSAGNDNVRFLDNGNIDFLRLPTSDPLVAGRLWNDSGTLKISAG